MLPATTHVVGQRRTQPQGSALGAGLWIKCERVFTANHRIVERYLTKHCCDQPHACAGVCEAPMDPIASGDAVVNATIKPKAMMAGVSAPGRPNHA